MLAAAGHPIRGPSSTESAPSIANWGTSFRGPAPVHAVAALVSGPRVNKLMNAAAPTGEERVVAFSILRV